MKTESPTSPARQYKLPEEPLLRVIAREIVERTLAVLDLEERLSGFGRVRKHAARLEARLASHRKALRLIDRELWSMGWTRDPDRPLKFVRRGKDHDENDWNLAGTAFHRALELS